MKIDSDWKATHLIVREHGEKLVFATVMLINGYAYTREEWPACDHSDFDLVDHNPNTELIDDSWLFRGETFTGQVVPLDDNIKELQTRVEDLENRLETQDRTRCEE